VAQKEVAYRIATAAEQLSSWLGPQVMRWLAHFHKWVSNPVLRLWATRVPKMAVIEHRGRSSGKEYQTPVMAFVEDGEIVVVLNYGTRSDWVRNVEAAGSAAVLHRGKRFRLTHPRVIPVDSTRLAGALAAGRTRSALHGTLVPA
jgi:deazaflavin-dependent oxidoreductase (nitroreductase family)